VFLDWHSALHILHMICLALLTSPNILVFQSHACSQILLDHGPMNLYDLFI
jgi:hypothetical protein